MKYMSAFLGVPANKVHQLTYNDRIPLPVKLGLGRCSRWSVFELLEWVGEKIGVRIEGIISVNSFRSVSRARIIAEPSPCHPDGKPSP